MQRSQPHLYCSSDPARAVVHTDCLMWQPQPCLHLLMHGLGCWLAVSCRPVWPLRAALRAGRLWRPRQPASPGWPPAASPPSTRAGRTRSWTTTTSCCAWEPGAPACSFMLVQLAQRRARGGSGCHCAGPGLQLAARARWPWLTLGEAQLGPLGVKADKGPQKQTTGSCPPSDTQLKHRLNKFLVCPGATR